MYFIAEIGVNHNGNMETAIQLIEKARDIGCSAVKFQSFKAEKLVSKTAPKVDYQRRTSDLSETHFEMLKKLELTEDMHVELFAVCKKFGIDFISTAYDAAAVGFLKSLGVEKIKVASADLIDHTIHREVVRHGLESFVSVGMASFDEIEQTLEIYKERLASVALLHCVSNYPCLHESINLSVLESLKEKFNCSIGFSDHSTDSIAAMLSVAYGASVIEKHFTLDKSMEGPDHAASSTPEEMAELISDVKLAQKIVGSPFKRLQDEELGMYKFSRKSVFTKTKISAGDYFTEDNLCLLRPGTGIPANKFFQIIGSKSTVDLEADEMLQLEDVTL